MFVTGAEKDVITVWMWISLRNLSDCAYSEINKMVSLSLQLVTMLQSKQWMQIQPIPMNFVTVCSNHCSFSANSTSNLFVIMYHNMYHNSPLCKTWNLHELTKLTSLFSGCGYIDMTPTIHIYQQNNINVFKKKTIPWCSSQKRVSELMIVLLPGTLS